MSDHIMFPVPNVAGVILVPATMKPVNIQDCPPGPFTPNPKEGEVYFKTEYREDDGRCRAYCPTGEFYHPEPDGLVYPLEVVTGGVWRSGPVWFDHNSPNA